MEYGVQIVSLAVIVTILIGYFQNGRMPLMSTKMFTGFLLLAFFNIIAEFSTLYTINKKRYKIIHSNGEYQIILYRRITDFVG